MKNKREVDWKLGVHKLRQAGEYKIANAIVRFKNKNGQKGGWDWWVHQYARTHKDHRIIEIIWN